MRCERDEAEVLTVLRPIRASQACYGRHTGRGDPGVLLVVLALALVLTLLLGCTGGAEL